MRLYTTIFFGVILHCLGKGLKNIGGGPANLLIYHPFGYGGFDRSPFIMHTNHTKSEALGNLKNLFNSIGALPLNDAKRLTGNSVGVTNTTLDICPTTTHYCTHRVDGAG